MFQYAAGRALSLRLALPLHADLSWFLQRFSKATTPREYALGVFTLPLKVSTTSASASTPLRSLLTALRKRLHRWPQLPLHLLSHHILEPHFHYWSGWESLQRPCILSGYWQSWRYFHQYADIIRQDFTFPGLTHAALPIREAIESATNSISLHIRRGDYVNNATTAFLHGIEIINYYKKSLLHFRSIDARATVFVFSDDPDWAKTNFCSKGLPYTVVSKDTGPLDDMQLMSLCTHHIIANSSFSWWAAWLSSQQGQTLAPARWFTDHAINTQDLCPPAWLRISA